MKHPIHFIITGGTIDSYFEPSVATTIPSRESIIPSYFETMIKPQGDVSFETICMKDSRDLTPEDRKAVFDAIKNAKTNHILLTHGTDAMVQTADYLREREAEKLGKVIVLVGSFIPLQHFALSDAGFNLGFAMQAAQTLSPGIYISMNAEIFEAGHVYKDKAHGRFVKK